MAIVIENGFLKDDEKECIYSFPKDAAFHSLLPVCYLDADGNVVFPQIVGGALAVAEIYSTLATSSTTVDTNAVKIVSQDSTRKLVMIYVDGDRLYMGDSDSQSFPIEVGSTFSFRYIGELWARSESSSTVYILSAK